MCRAANWSAVMPDSGPATPKSHGFTQLSHVASIYPCGSGVSPGLLRSPETMVRCWRSGSSGWRIGVISKLAPVCGGDHRSMTAPCGNPMKAKRFGAEPAAVCAHAVAAGFIASRSGSAMLAPTPFNTARRETCFLKTYMCSPFSVLASQFVFTFMFAFMFSVHVPVRRLLPSAYCAAAVEVSAGATFGTRRILNCSLRTTAWTSAENR